jgi:hypothetical protein
MFVRDVVQIERPFEVVAPRFLRNPAWLEPLLWSVDGEVAARCQRGTARRRADSLVVPIRWALADTAAFQSLEGDLAIAPDGPTRSRVTFEATYSLAESSGDTQRLVTESAVEAAVRAFLTGLAVTLQTVDATEQIRPWAQ